MENPCVEQFLSSLAQSLKPGYPEFISGLNSSECRREIDSLLNDRCDVHTASKGPLLSCLLLNFHRQTSLAFQSTAILEKEIESLKAQNASLFHEVQSANKKAMRYLEDLHTAEVDLCSHKEELLKLRAKHLVPPQTFNTCDSGYSDSHSSMSERLTPPPLRQWEQFPTDPRSTERRSAPQPPHRDRDNSRLTSHVSSTDLHSVLSSPQDAAYLSRPQTYNGLIHSPSYSQVSDDVCSASVSEPERKTVAYNVQVNPNASLASPLSGKTTQSLRLETLELLAKDIEHFDPGNCDLRIEDYLTELDHTLIDLPNATQREKSKLVWKTSSKAVHRFIQAQPPSIRNDYIELCQALIEEFSSPADIITSMVAALQIKHTRREHPKEFYKRLRHAYFQGKNAPGFEEDPTFKSLFLRNLHPCVRTHVALMVRQGNPSMHEIRKMTQMAWETVVTSKTEGKVNTPDVQQPRPTKTLASSKAHPHTTPKGGDKRPCRDTERSRHVHQQRRHRDPPIRSSRRPYSEIMAHTHDLPIDSSDDDRSLSDHLSHHSYDSRNVDSASECLSDFGSPERYSAQPKAKKASRSKSYRGSLSRF